MAQAPSNEQVEALRKQSEEAERKKRESQAKQGKDFENKGQGVIPEKVWRKLPGKEENNG